MSYEDYYDRDEDEGNEPVEILTNAIEKHEREKAILYAESRDFGADEHWIPKSVILETTNHRDGTVDISVPLWFAEKNGFV